MIPQIERDRERRAMWRWMVFIGAFFAFEFVLWGTAIYVVHDDPSHAVVEDYDKKALAWDEQRIAEAASDALGWSARVALAPAGELRIVLSDGEGAPVAGAKVTAEVFHRARAGRAVTLQLAETEPGTYAAPVTVDRPGRWLVRLVAERAGDRFLHTGEVLVAGEGGP